MIGQIKTKREFGDYQTPTWFCNQVCSLLKNKVLTNPTVVLEPTCGVGNFLVTSTQFFKDAKFVGIEIAKEHALEAKSRVKDTATIVCDDMFSFDFSTIKELNSNHGSILIIGNPPWVNNSTLSTLNSFNQPLKTNFKGLKGIDAITGSANFDICEYIILQLVEAFKGKNAVIAMLCKTIVARNVFKELIRNNIDFDLAQVLTFDTKKVFNVSADGCLFIIRLTQEKNTLSSCSVYNFDKPTIEVTQFGYKNGKFYSQLKSNCLNLDGHSCFEWRQGVKHDCSKVMELTVKNGCYYNGNKEKVSIENGLVFPLVKSSHIKNPIITEFKKYVIITQKRVRQDTKYIQHEYPKLWYYLSQNNTAFTRRKSSIYKNSPSFSMFGIGEYSFAPYKVGISGFYKEPIFALLNSAKPVMMDDTCYFIPFSNYNDAYVAMLTLNSSLVNEFIKSISFPDSKRPFTKKVLERIDFLKCVSALSISDYSKTEANLNLPHKVTSKMIHHFIDAVTINTDEP